MGTAGPLGLARELLDDGSGEPFFVLNRCCLVRLPAHGAPMLEVYTTPRHCTCTPRHCLLTSMQQCEGSGR